MDVAEVLNISVRVMRCDERALSFSILSPLCTLGVAFEATGAGGVFREVLVAGCPPPWGPGRSSVQHESMSAYLTDTRGAHHKISMIASRTLWFYASRKPPSAESSMRNMIASRTLWVYASSKPPSANPLCMRIVLLVESSWILRSCGPATTNSLRCQAKVSIITSNVPHSVH